MLASNETALRRVLARFLGWADEHKDAVEHALRSIELAAAHRAALVLLAETDFVPIALALHRVTRGASAPFVLCDPLCRDTPASVRSPGNRVSGVAALAAAAGGSLCLRSWRLPLDFSATVERARDLASDVQIIICAEERHLANPFLILPVPIWVPSLRTRTSELPRIVMECALDAVAELGVPETSFTEADCQWVLEHAPMTLAEIQKATLRLVALRASPSLSRAAERLGMAEVSLRRWIGGGELPPILHDPELRRELKASFADDQEDGAVVVSRLDALVHGELVGELRPAGRDERDMVPISEETTSEPQPPPALLTSNEPHLVGYRPLAIPFIPHEKLTLDRTVLIELLEHAASAARIVGHLDDAIAAGPLGDHIDAVVHGLTELLGDPRMLAGPDGSASDDRGAYDRAPMLASGAGGAP